MYLFHTYYVSLSSWCSSVFSYNVYNKCVSVFLSFLSSCNKLMKPKEGSVRISVHGRCIQSQDHSLSLDSGNWHRRQSWHMELFTCGIWCYLQGNSFSTELNSMTLSWYSLEICLHGTQGEKKSHTSGYNKCCAQCCVTLRKTGCFSSLLTSRLFSELWCSQIQIL